METARLIVCESSGTWAISLRRLMGPLRVYETRSLAGCWRALEEAPASLVCLEWPPQNDDEWLARLTGLRFDFPRARAVILASAPTGICELAWREAGAAHVVHAPRQLEPLKTIIHRHLKTAPIKKHQSSIEEFWDQLPWSS